MVSGENTEAGNKEKSHFRFLKGGQDWFDHENLHDHDAQVGLVRSSLTEAMNAKNIAFLLGAGCSSFHKEGREVGIPTMAPLAAEFIQDDLPANSDDLFDKENQKWANDKLGIDVTEGVYRQNLERLMEILHAFRFVVTKRPDNGGDVGDQANVLIEKIQKFVREKCLNGPFAKGDRSVLSLYESFFRKLVYRDRSLPRPWVFTTNYDLFPEKALDSLGIMFCNGFAGVIDRRFNPASFRYALAEQLDVSARKWAAVDNYVYLGKLHGSVNWYADDDSGIHGVREVQKPTVDDPGEAMIYPTPMKHQSVLASPYSDLFREFQSQIVNEQTVLVTLGYSFGDEHINAIIYQALTIPTFRLIIFGSPEQPEISRLIQLDDPRIWVVGGNFENGEPSHYFAQIIENFLPELPGERIEGSVQKVVNLIREGMTPPGPQPSSDGQGDSDDR